ncbi:hypothetical protein G6O69_23760 [Pseudenhygromyxa sp. WMMC2535]|uniref:hypothetical protein n=1 Tax=Pseudenhygromyxa sp. WMMC2535 TaxID=2712867 RepID=UPI001553D52D|nr:hypothetical protein [Pseudenhygromyxa sp. WMMC2535]NVB40876.1 hypothetical protein [Pseudenhygromyxa sp. WMMC2535]
MTTQPPKSPAARAPSPHVAATVERLRASEQPAIQRADALVELATDLQKQPRDPQELIDALYLYDEALALVAGQDGEGSEGGDAVARARILAGRGAALRRMPGSGVEELLAARDAFAEALPVLHEAGDAEEVAEVEMSYGLVLHALAPAGMAALKDAVQAYQRALRTFDAQHYPREFATLHNNLATAYLSLRLAPEKEGLREAMAVQSFRQALEVVTLEEDPSEYAMLQNNLGNALQAMRSSHPWENLLRAVEAYDAALEVRTEYDTPVEFANTLANKANALMNLPDDVDAPERGNPDRLRQAIALLHKAGDIFARCYLPDRAQIVKRLAAELDADLRGAATGGGAEVP